MYYTHEMIMVSRLKLNDKFVNGLVTSHHVFADIDFLIIIYLMDFKLFILQIYVCHIHFSISVDFCIVLFIF